MTYSSLKRARDEYEMRKRGLLSPPPVWASRLLWDGLCAPVLLALRLGYGLREANKRHHETLQKEAFKRTYPIGPQDWALVTYCQLGDVYLFASLARGLLLQHGGTRVTFFTKPQHAFIPRLFPSVSESIALEPRFLPFLGGSHNLIPYPPDANKGRYFQPAQGIINIVGYANMVLLDAHRAGFRLSSDTPPEKPRAPHPHELEAAHAFLAQHHLTPGHVVILCPDATSTDMLPSIPDQFWNALILSLKKLGLQCVTNVGGPAQRVLNDAPSLHIPLEELRAVACVAGHLISNRSGVCDLVSDLPLNLAVLYPDAPFFSGTLLQSTSLHAMGLSDTATELVIDPHNWQPTLEALLATMEGGASRKDDGELPTRVCGQT